jgi:myo-inositol-1(or 4)-monophosphatase
LPAFFISENFKRKMLLPLDKIRKQVCTLAEETGAFIQQQGKKITAADIETKSKNNFVTYVDKAAERRLVKGLQKILPDAGFITEEKTISNERKKYTWIIDPLDGTTNFIHGLPCYCISIGLFLSPSGGGDRLGRRRKDSGEVILGIIYEPSLDEMFYAIKNGGAFLNGKKISVTKTNKLKGALLATGFPTYDYTRMEQYLALFRHFMKNTHGIRRMGSAAIDLAYTACGRFDAFYEYSLNPWDVAAGVLIVQESGGKISDFSGGTNFLFGKEIIASNGKLQKELERSIGKFFR